MTEPTFDKKKIKAAAQKLAEEFAAESTGIDGECEKHNLRWWDGGLDCPACIAEDKAAAWDALTVTLKKYSPVLQAGAVSGKWHIDLLDTNMGAIAGDDPAALVVEAVERMKKGE